MKEKKTSFLLLLPSISHSCHSPTLTHTHTHTVTFFLSLLSPSLMRLRPVFELYGTRQNESQENHPTKVC